MMIDAHFFLHDDRRSIDFITTYCKWLMTSIPTHCFDFKNNLKSFPTPVDPLLFVRLFRIEIYCKLFKIYIVQ